MKSAATISHPGDRPLLDRVRESNRIEELIGAVDQRVKIRERRKRNLRRASLAAGCLVVLLAWAVPYYRETETVMTAAARRQALVLADGSQADLNANTTLFSDFRYGRRTIRLDRGEAYFSVAKDAAHPFLVQTPAGTVRVTGTKFNVRIPAEGHAEITLLEGSIAFEREAASPAELSPGQQLDTALATVRTLTDDELSHITVWRQGRLALGGLTLAEAVARLGAYHGREITCSPQVADLLPGGTFALDDFPGFIEALETTLPVQVLDQGNGRYRVISRP